MTYNKRYYMISILAILAVIINLSLSGMGVGAYIDMPTLVGVALIVFIGSKITSEYKNNFIVGGALLFSSMGMVAILANLSDPKELGAAIAVVLITLLYAFIYIFFISNIKQILLSDSIAYQNNNLEFSKSYYSYQVLFIFTIALMIYLSGTGFGAYVDIPSLLMFLPLLATVKIEDKLKGLLLRQNLLFGFVVVNFLISMIGMFGNSNASNVGPMIAIAILSTTYAMYFYIAWIKPKLSKIKYDNNKFETRFYVSIALTIIVPFLTLVFYMLEPTVEKTKQTNILTLKEQSILKKILNKNKDMKEPENSK